MKSSGDTGDNLKTQMTADSLPQDHEIKFASDFDLGGLQTICGGDHLNMGQSGLAIISL